MQLPFYRYYGVLYNYTAAMNGAECTNSNPSGVQGICPNGWHLPSRSEYMELIQSLPDGDKGSQLAGLYNYGIMFWNNGALSQSPKFGLSGLNILPAGRHYAGHPNDYVEETACVWTTSLSTLNSIHNGISIFTISYYETDAHVENTSFHRANSASVRCIKNRFEYDCNTYITDTLEACDSLTWRDGSTYTESNRTATYRIPGENGCDTVYSLWLTIYHSSETTDDIDACESYTWINGITYTGNNNSATYMLQSVHGCDSLVHLNLRIHHTPQDIFVDTRTACDSLVWIDGNTYYEDNDEAIFTTITSAGCDSVVRLNLTIIHPVEYEFNYSDCGAYQWNGQWYTRTGDYTYTYPSAASNGCDSIVTLHYTRLNNNVNDTIYACDSYTWIDGVTYTLDDIGTRPYINALYIGTNSYGCDSLVVMYLFLQANKTIDTHRACESYTWIDGNTYTESNNTATVTYTNQYGCDSIVQLNLTIEHPDNTIHEVTVEECSYYQMSNGEYFTESGDYQRTLQSSCGCDSIVLLHLTITGENGMEGTFYDNRDGITYRTMQYGCQTWMAEDLRTSYLPNGTLIADSIIHCPGDIGLLTYNNYYNTFYANSNNGFCPQGWHLPSSSEWLELANYLTIHSEYTCNETSIVKSIVSNIGWTISNVECSPGHNQSENNLSGLGLNPDGMQWLGGMYKDGLHDREDYVYLVGTNAFYINANSTVVNISNNSTDINFQDLGCTYGARIRCVRDN